MTGRFVTFEGGEGAGKTTLVAALYPLLEARGEKVLMTRAPGGTALGASLRSLLLHKDHALLSSRAELFLFLADRAQHVEEVIIPALKAGALVLCDRFNDSTIAYQGGARNFDVAFLENLCAFASQDLEPSLTFYLDIDPHEGAVRAAGRGQIPDRMEKEQLNVHERIRAIYLDLAKKYPHRIHVLDALKPVSALVDEALQWIL